MCRAASDYILHLNGEARSSNTPESINRKFSPSEIRSVHKCGHNIITKDYDANKRKVLVYTRIRIPHFMGAFVNLPRSGNEVNKQ